VNTDSAHDVGWVSREECKRGHVPTGETVLIVQASPDWSVAHTDEAPAVRADRLASKAATVLEDDRLARPAWTDARLWDRALPAGAVEDTPLPAARESGLHLAGDAIAGERRIHAALRSGLEVGKRLAAEA
jgi:renalase